MKTPLIYTKLQLIKKLKEDGNYNEAFVKDLHYWSDYIWKRGSYDEVTYNFTEKRTATIQKKAHKTIEEVLISLDSKYDRKLKGEIYEEIMDDLSYSISDNEYEAVKCLIEEITKDMKPEVMNDLDLSTLSFETKMDEFISASVSASVMSFFVKGSIKDSHLNEYSCDWENYKTVTNRV
jgi:hypothetical protein